jgi:ribosome-associated heat shock protein Hsp15
VNGSGAKPHKLVRVGDLVILTTPVGKRQLRVRSTGERRGPASVAQSLYEDLTAPALRAQAPPGGRSRGAGRPTKRERRQIERFRPD